jgi:hypothetical protein
VREGDVFSQGYRSGTLANRGLSPEELAALRPGLIYVSLCAFSHKGPWASRRGFDTVVQNVSGIRMRQGELFPGAEPGPQFYPVSAIDYLNRLPDGFRRDGGVGAPRSGRRELARAHLTGADRTLAGRPRGGARGGPQGCTQRVPSSRDRPLVDRERDPRSAAFAISGQRCAFPRHRPIGPGPPSRSATTSPSGPPAYDAGQRANRYIPILTGSISLIVYILAGRTVLQAWNVAAFAWFSSDFGRRITGNALSIGVVLVIALALWELSASAIELFERD